MKQAQPVEIAYLISGTVVSQRRLSRRGERRAGISAFALVAAMSLAAALLVGVALMFAHRVLNAAPYLAVWTLAGLGAAVAAAVGVSRRARSYRIGTSIDDDAFAASPLPLVRRTSGGYALRLTPGMTGQLESGREPIDISPEQMGAFCGNVLELEGQRGQRIIVLSDRAFRAFTIEQRSILEREADLVHIDLTTIEAHGGGSARCMLAELY